MYLLILSLLVAFTPLYDCDDSRKHVRIRIIWKKNYIIQDHQLI